MQYYIKNTLSKRLTIKFPLKISKLHSLCYHCSPAVCIPVKNDLLFLKKKSKKTINETALYILNARSCHIVLKALGPILHSAGECVVNIFGYSVDTPHTHTRAVQQPMVVPAASSESLNDVRKSFLFFLSKFMLCIVGTFTIGFIHSN